MSAIEFFRTRMGHTFIEGTMPRIAEHLAALPKFVEGLVELNMNIKELVAELKLHRQKPSPPAESMTAHDAASSSVAADEQETEVVRGIFELYLKHSGGGRRIADELNRAAGIDSAAPATCGGGCSSD